MRLPTIDTLIDIYMYLLVLIGVVMLIAVILYALASAVALLVT